MRTIEVLLAFAFVQTLVAKPFGFDDWFSSQETRSDIFQDEVDHVLDNSKVGEPLFAEQMDYFDEQPGATEMPKMTTKGDKMTTEGHRMTTKGHRMTTKGHEMTTKGHLMTTKGHEMTYKPMKPIGIPVKSLMKMVMSKMVKLYWSLHKIAKMVRMHKMQSQLQHMGVTTAPIQPPLLLPSTLLKLTQVQLVDLYWSMKQLQDLVSKRMPKPMPTHHYKRNGPEPEFFHGAEIEIAKLHWMMKYCTKYLEEVAEGHRLPSEPLMTGPPMTGPPMTGPPMTGKPMTGKPPKPDPKHVVMYIVKMFEEASKEVPKLLFVLKHVTELTEEKERAYMKHMKKMKERKM